MAKQPPSQLDYAKLLKEAKHLQADPRATPLRVALLGDCATQQLVPLLRLLFAQSSIQAEIYEAGFDTADAEVYDAASGLYAFTPDVIVLLDSAQRLREAFFAAATERTSFAAHTIERLTGRWAAIAGHSTAMVLQSTFVTPLERPFGNYERKMVDSLQETVTTINRGLIEEARAQKAVLINDIAFVASLVGRESWFDERLWYLAKSYCALQYLPRVAQNIVDVVLATRGGGVKCLVLDLDNTLWGGVIGDDGLEGIRLGHLGEGESFVYFQRFLLDLSRRGLLLAVCSKNDHANAIRPFHEHPEMVIREADITMFVANWSDKASNITLIKETLNIGFDSIVFLDDNPFERNLVRELLPEVIVPELPEDPAEYVKAISELNLFETATHSDLDAQRTDLYKKAAKREDIKRNFATVEEYLQSLQMEIDLRRFNEFDLPRIAQLIQRSNQFNLATQRYSEAQCAAFMRDERGYYPLSVSLRDRFGDYGLISVALLRFGGTTCFIDEYLMSCRVLQRGVEQFVMNHVFEAARAQGLHHVEGVYRPTKKNAMVATFYRQFGFHEIESGTEGSRWSLHVDEYQPKSTFMSLPAHQP